MKLISHYMEQRMKLHSKFVNWTNHVVGDGLLYSYRDTAYDRNTYPSDLHYHDYYELVIFEEGDIRYICDCGVCYPQYGDIILIPPGKFHMSAINCEKTNYKRHVFYLYPSAFDYIGHSALTAFLPRKDDEYIFSLNSLESKEKLMEALGRLKDLLGISPSPLEDALKLSYIISVFYLLNQKEYQVKKRMSSLPENILSLQHYIDRNFAEISSVSQIAEHFFYSREYVSRLFKRYFDTTISDYIMKRRISESQQLITNGVPLIDVAYQVGFGSFSAFIRAFRSVTNMTPSEYRKLRKELTSK